MHNKHSHTGCEPPDLQPPVKIGVKQQNSALDPHPTMGFSQFWRGCCSLFTETWQEWPSAWQQSVCPRAWEHHFGLFFNLVMPFCSIFTATSSPEHLQDAVAHVCRVLLRWQRCVSICTVLQGFLLLTPGQAGGVWVWVWSPAMCPDGSAGDGCLRNQQNSSCLARAEPLVLPRAGKKQGRYKCSGWKWKVFLLCTQQELQHGVTAPGAQNPPAPSRVRRCSSKLLPARVWASQEEPLQAEGRWAFTEQTFHCIKQFSLSFYV